MCSLHLVAWKDKGYSHLAVDLHVDASHTSCPTRTVVVAPCAMTR